MAKTVDICTAFFVAFSAFSLNQYLLAHKMLKDSVEREVFLPANWHWPQKQVLPFSCTSTSFPFDLSTLPSLSSFCRTPLRKEGSKEGRRDDIALDLIIHYVSISFPSLRGLHMWSPPNFRLIYPLPLFVHKILSVSLQIVGDFLTPFLCGHHIWKTHYSFPSPFSSLLMLAICSSRICARSL